MQDQLLSATVLAGRGGEKGAHSLDMMAAAYSDMHQAPSVYTSATPADAFESVTRKHRSNISQTDRQNRPNCFSRSYIASIDHKPEASCREEICNHTFPSSPVAFASQRSSSSNLHLPPLPPHQLMAVRPESRIGHYLDGHLQLVKVLGVGAYGVVYAAVDIYDNTSYAVKALSKVGSWGLSLDDAQKKFQAREISLHARARRHPNIVSLIEILDGPDCVYVVM